MIDQLWPPETSAAAPRAMAKPLTRFADAATPADIRPAAFPAPYHTALHRIQRVGGGWRHSATGAPLLAGDPHLAFGFPGIWYSGEDRHAGHGFLPARPHPACRSWYSATTARSPGPSPPPAPTCRTCSLKPLPDPANTRRLTVRSRSVREERIEVRGQPDRC